MIYLLQQLLIYSAKLYPNKDAVVYGNERITYKDLDQITNKLARTLKANGVKKGDRVGIYINKSIPSIISIQGILKAEAVYVPLDPNAPLSRLAFIIQNCGIRCLLTSTKKAGTLSNMFPERNPLEVVVLTDNLLNFGDDSPIKVIPWEKVVNQDASPHAENSTIEADLAYILYTSGSTGLPKGVMISHLNALTFINWGYATFNVNSEDQLSNHAPLHFDLSIFDIFVAFKAGATLVLVPETISTFPIRLAELIQNTRITVWYSVPSILIQLVNHGDLKKYKFPNLRTILFAGEVFPVKYLRQLMALLPQAQFYNLYGPTETNVCTYYHVKEISPDRLEPYPIGKAISNVEVFALNDHNQRAKTGEVGELVARGSTVMSGYWGLPDKTNSVLTLNPLQSYYRDYIYHTGDLVKQDEDGNYLFIGRKDNMIKSRGYRIELGEIETTLYSHKKIKECAVIAIPDDQIGNKIKAFIVLQRDEILTKIEIEKYCLERIPKYMLPEVIEFSETLPKTSTGKIDKQSLTRISGNTV
ncbi:MAG: D-alanine--poly(phosphoribitol) ligase [Candidatus Brocadia sp. UTAMX2]|jgi:amino acid adenylation domain-containing protein|nr:MAG: D-alanine--poly(phosphoribitol) ligase [Candidatus Brocadia sp. UTAMX2]